MKIIALYTRKLHLAGSRLLVWVAFLVSPAAHATLTTIWVGAGSACDTSSLVLAITEASNAAGDKTRINLVNDQTYTGFSNLALDYVNVEIDGGYAHCHDATPDASTAIVGSGSNRVMSLFSGNESRQVTLRDLEIRGGDVNGNGGGLHIYGGIYAVFDDVYVHGNAATSGAGVGVYTNGVGQPTLVLTGGTLISTNVATDAGGGIDCDGASIVLGGASIDSNHAGDESTGDGGGISVSDCAVQSAGGLDADNVIFGNQAYAGGGIYASSGSTIDLGVMGGRARVNANTAVSAGGGIFLNGSGTEATLAATQMVANQASSGIGGAVFVENYARFTLDRGDRDEVCPVASPCSALVSNIADQGAAVYAANGAVVILRRLEIDSPVDASVGSVVAGNGGGIHTLIELYGVLMDRLRADAALQVADHAVVVAADLTLAGNHVSSDFALQGNSTSLNLQHSIVWDTGAVAVTGLGSVYSLDNNSYDTSTLPGMDFDPGFADPASDDFHLRADSLNVDAYTPMAYTDSVDLDGNPRPYDLAPDNGGIFDRGAYELGDEIFADGFDMN